MRRRSSTGRAVEYTSKAHSNSSRSMKVLIFLRISPSHNIAMPVSRTCNLSRTSSRGPEGQKWARRPYFWNTPECKGTRASSGSNLETLRSSQKCEVEFPIKLVRCCHRMMHSTGYRLTRKDRSQAMCNITDWGHTTIRCTSSHSPSQIRVKSVFC